MPDKSTLQDHVADLMAEVYRLAGEIEDYKAANTELRYQLELAREEANQSYKRADQYRSRATANADSLAEAYATIAELISKLKELRGE
jgi:predicted RNase H-like nuclease (RuvC/YqgF family)